MAAPHGSPTVSGVPSAVTPFQLENVHRLPEGSCAAGFGLQPGLDAQGGWVCFCSGKMGFKPKGARGMRGEMPPPRTGLSPGAPPQEVAVMGTELWWEERLGQGVPGVPR